MNKTNRSSTVGRDEGRATIASLAARGDGGSRRRPSLFLALILAVAAGAARAQSNCQPLLPVNAVTSMSAIRAVRLNCDPNVCAPGQFPTGIDGYGNAINCTPAAQSTSTFTSPATFIASVTFVSPVLFDSSTITTGPASFLSSASFVANGIRGTGVSSFTYVPAGSTQQSAFAVAFATVTVTLTGGYDLMASLNCGVTLANQIQGCWSILYDGAPAFGNGAAVGAVCGNGSTAGQAYNLSGPFPIRRDEITAGVHKFGLTFIAEAGGNTIAWPNAFGGQSSNCRFGVTELH